jgi:hypothetical protein
MEFIAIFLILAVTATMFLAAARRRRAKSEASRTPVEPRIQRLRSPAPAELPETGQVPSVYLHSSQWDTLLVVGDDGMPPLSVVPYRGEWWLRENTTGLLVGVANRHLSRLGIWTAHL